MEKELIVKWNIKKGETARILEMLPTLATETRKESGNLFYAIYQSENDPNEIILHETYIDEQSLEFHKNSAHYQEIVVEKIIPNLEIREVTLVKRIF